MTDPIYCYYHRHARLEIIQRHGQTYAVCPECRQVLSNILANKIYKAGSGKTIPSDDLLSKLLSMTPDDIKRANRANSI